MGTTCELSSVRLAYINYFKHATSLNITKRRAGSDRAQCHVKLVSCPRVPRRTGLHDVKRAENTRGKQNATNIFVQKAREPLTGKGQEPLLHIPRVPLARRLLDRNFLKKTTRDAAGLDSN